MNPSATASDYQWLARDPGARWLEQAVAELAGHDELGRVQALRRWPVTPHQARLLAEQCRLRQLGRAKFSQAARMLFQSRLLQQATSEPLASAKARRFAAAPHVVDFCCGLGGDLLGLAARTRVTGVDRDEVATCLARHNVGSLSPEFRSRVGSVVTGDAAATGKVPPDAWFHVDPDRRAGGARSTRPRFFSPGPDVLEQLIGTWHHGGVKLAPASPVPETWQPVCERQWLGDRSECKQQVLWFGETARQPGIRSAAAVDTRGQLTFDLRVPESEVRSPPVVAREPSAWLLEPHATVIAAGLTDALCRSYCLSRLAAEVDYLTAGQPPAFAGVTAFRILETTRLKLRDVREALRRQDGGLLEIKKRGVDHRLTEPFSRLGGGGNRPLTLVLTRTAEGHLALICSREPDPNGGPGSSG